METTYKEIRWIIDTTIDKTLSELGLKKDLLSKSEMYRRYGRKTIDKAIKNNQLTPKRVGERWLYSDSQFKSTIL